MSIEHKTSERVVGIVHDDNIIQRQGSRIVGVKGPTFISKFYTPICVNRREIATMLAGQLAEQLVTRTIGMDQIFEVADAWVIEERRSAKAMMSTYFELYMETDQTVEEAMTELEHDFSLGTPE